MNKTFLCWNLNKRPLQTLVSSAVQTCAVDVLILLECEIPASDLLRALNPPGQAVFHYAADQITNPDTGIRIFTRFSPEFCVPVSQGPRFTLRHVRLPLRTDFILAVVHFPSKSFWDDNSQQQECTALSRTVAEGEARIGHTRTVLVGDLNMNPFEPGMVGATALNATMVRGEAMKMSRVVNGISYPFFHNPMWSHFGDGAQRPPGTYYYRSPGHVSYYWNMFDQVLVRPGLLDQFLPNSVRILDRIGEVSLLTNSGKPDKSVASDHLPLLFSLDV